MQLFQRPQIASLKSKADHQCVACQSAIGRALSKHSMIARIFPSHFENVDIGLIVALTG